MDEKARFSKMFMNRKKNCFDAAPLANALLERFPRSITSLICFLQSKRWLMLLFSPLLQPPCRFVERLVL
ncbi:hypothetical protein QT235_04130 [Geobacillus stearothermophilus]|nr:hypothetical protein QT235_04130 [Geobacillus stearothermophilus]